MTENAHPRSRIRGRQSAGEARVTTDVGADRAAPQASGLARRGRRRALRGRAGILIPFLVLFAVLSLTSEPFATRVNLLNILDQQSATLIIAAAGTLVLVAGGIDLSVGATYSASPAVDVGALRARRRPGVAIAARDRRRAARRPRERARRRRVLRINSLITTLAMAFIVSGCASLVTGGQPARALRQARLRQARPHRVPDRQDVDLADDRRRSS